MLLVFLGVALVFLILLFWPKFRGAQEASRRFQCKNNLKSIGLALHNYHDVHGMFPPAYVADEKGRPIHSWRVLILPFIDGKATYGGYDLHEPWDGPNNIKLLDKIPAIYVCPTHGKHDGFTAYAGVFGDGCVFRGPVPVKLSDITDESKDTLMICEVTNAQIPWTKPADVDVRQRAFIDDPHGFSSSHVSGLHCLFADGRVLWLNNTISQEVWKALCTRDGGERLEDY